MPYCYMDIINLRPEPRDSEKRHPNKPEMALSTQNGDSSGNPPLRKKPRAPKGGNVRLQGKPLWLNLAPRLLRKPERLNQALAKNSMKHGSF
ncbi:hypothetical protein Trydic_g16790 [Trypoxylus dichotomus]